MLLPPLRLQALRARRRRRTPQAAAPRHAPEAHRTAPALPPSHLRPCPDATLREPGTLLDHRPLPAAGAAAHPAHHRRDGAPPGEQPGGELHLLQLLRERDARQHQVPQRPETLHDGEGGRAIPYNVDSILGTPECIITEGEFDAAAIIAAGRKDVVSVPAGAQSNLTWLDRFVESHFEDKQAIYIAVDEDPAGQSLRQELTRRLGVERCRIVHFGEGCKDANEHLVKYGAESLRICIEQAEEVPLEGIFTAEDCRDDLRSLYENGLQRGADTGWDNFDEHCTFEPRRLLVMTGRPGDGKSEFTDELVLRLCLRHEWKIAFFSPENMPIAYHLHKLAEKLTGHRFTPGPGMTEAVYGQAVGWLDRNVSHILPDDGSYGIDHILEKARQVVRRKGVRILVIDPMNRLEQRLEPGQTEMDYITDTLNKLGRFATRNQCLVILVAHPRKVNRNEKDGTRRRVEMNDINGSANFANMSDFCLVVDRNDTKQIATIYIEKVRFKHLGSAHTEAKFVYNHLNGRYWPCEEDVIHTPQGEQLGPVNTQFDNENWLKNNEEQGRLFE